MGQLTRHPFKKWQQDYGLEYFVETGTWHGDGLLAAARGAAFQLLFSIEVQPALAVKAARRMQAKLGVGWNGRWEVLCNDSVDGIQEVLRRISATGVPVLWWLDAHLPERYDAQGTRLPLSRELGAIFKHLRPHTRDVFLIDDLRLYERGPFEQGDFPGGPPGEVAHEFMWLRLTHDLHRDYRDQGYLVALPRHGAQDVPRGMV